MKTKTTPTETKYVMMAVLRQEGYDAARKELEHSATEITPQFVRGCLERQKIQKAIQMMSVVGVLVSDAEVSQLCEEIAGKLKASRQ